MDNEEIKEFIKNNTEFKINKPQKITYETFYMLLQMATKKVKENCNLQNVSGCCTDSKHRRQITEKELKLAAKEVKLERGLIEYLINKVRKMQVSSGNHR